MYPDHSVDELLHMRSCSDLLGDYAESTRLTNALSERGAFDRDKTGSQLLRAAALHHPTAEYPPGESHGATKLTERAVRAIRAAYEDGERVNVLARAFGVHAQTIRNVGEGRSWRGI